MDKDLTETEALLIAIYVAWNFLDPLDEVWFYMTEEAGLGLIRSCPMDHECGDSFGGWWRFYTDIGGDEYEGSLPPTIESLLDNLSGYSNGRGFSECWEVYEPGSASSIAHEKLQRDYLHELDRELQKASAAKAASEPFVPAMFEWAVADGCPLSGIVTSEMLCPS